MSGTALAAVWQLGGRIAAQALGLPFSQYRCGGVAATAPAIAAATLLASIPAWITADDKLMAAKPFAYGKPVGFAAVDPALTQAGDYLVGAIVLGAAVETFFIATQDIPAVIQVVRCNAVMTVVRPAGPQPGQGYYGGDTTADETPLLTGWPASLIDKGRRQTGEVKLPGDMDLGYYEVLLPASVPVQLRAMDVLYDNSPQKNRFIVSAVEQTPIGWRLTARAAVA